MATRLKDIARDLDLSVVTVSKVLRDHPDISAQTRERVLKRVKDLNYHPNLAARALVTGRTSIIGLVVPDLVHPFFGQVAKGLSRALRSRGYSIVVSPSEDDPELEQQEIELLLSRRVDALVVASVQSSTASFRRIEEQQTPYILVDRRFPGLASNFVGVNDKVVGRLATTHLIEGGCKRLAHISGTEVSTAKGRLEGFYLSAATAGIGVDARYIIRREHGDSESDVSGYEAMKKLLALDRPPDGVFCFNDPTAMGAMKAILEARLRIPEDIAVVGCGNVAYAEFLRVPLTSIDQQSDAIGERTGKLALNLLDKKSSKARQLILEPRLVVRASTRRLP